jgi:hypothetical protein
MACPYKITIPNGNEMSATPHYAARVRAAQRTALAMTSTPSGNS